MRPLPLLALAFLLAAPSLAEEPPAALAAFAGSLAAGPADLSGIAGRTYVPAYSSLMAGGGATRLDFSVTLAIHNGSATRGIAIERIEYHDTTGRLVETPLDRPVTLKPNATIQVTIPQSDTRGGVGADFVVDWTAPTGTGEPIVEAVMLSSHGNQSYSFVSPGRRVER